ncbi:MAG: hypothetical protein DSY46_03130 [Hydrogenimonas sp.]|nr:MAG: hypothetical protein DSY46_03130 [Hydrogenimonas sp.]
MIEEEVIILAEEDDPPSQEDRTQTSTQTTQKRKKPLRLLAILAAILLLIAVIIVIIAKKESTPSSSTHTPQTQTITKPKPSKEDAPLPPLSQLEQMIEKANLLYDGGNKEDALNLFEQIATFSASISNYNLGVAQMRQERYDEAIQSFKKAIQNGENRCISAINAAACALYLGDELRFQYYLQMAEAYLPDSYNSSLHSYLYGLINYYKGNYFEILSAVNHPLGKSYQKELEHLGAISYTVFDRPLQAITLLERSATPKDYLTLGQLYAAIGDYTVAVQYLERSLKEADTPLKSRKTLALIQLKNQMPQQSAEILKELQEVFDGKGLNLYPIHAKISPAVYEIDAAQKRYAADAILMVPTAFKLIFEFAPFKVFNSLQTLNYIKKGNTAIYIDEEKEAAKYLSNSSNLSQVNLLISKAIQATLDHHLRDALSILKSALKHYPNHSILHYNLGLIYARLGEIHKAHQHFLRSYHLDSSNYLSGIFTLMCEELTNTPIPQIEKLINEDLRSIAQPTTEQHFYRTLFNFYRSDFSSAKTWLKVQHDNRPIYLLMDLLLNANLGYWQQAQESVTKLRDRLPHDVMTHLLYLQIHYRERNIKQFSLDVQRYLKTHPLDLNTIYYGSTFTRENYIALRFITGTLYPLKQKLEKRLLEELKDPTGIMDALALSNIYLKLYEEAYVLYNQLIDQYKRQDSRTLFLAAIASIGAGHHASATALFELAKLTDPNNLESRYALGLLYLEAKNYEAAIMQFSKIPNGAFKSEYFDFDIVAEKADQR